MNLRKRCLRGIIGKITSYLPFGVVIAMTLYSQKVPYRDMYEPDDQNPQSSDALMKLLDGAKNLWCEAYGNSPVQSFPGGVGALNRGVYDSICKPTPTPLPPAPAPPFEGGQCEGTTYRVTGTFTSQNLSGAGGCGVQQEFWCNSPGAIVGLNDPAPGNNYVVKRSDGGSVPIRGRINGQDQSGTVVFTDPPCVNITAPYWGNGAVITNVVAIDGPDNCGSLPVSYPPETPPVPTYNIDIDISSPGSPDPINIPLVYVPFNTEFNLNPYIDMGGIEIQFNLDGMELKYDDEVTPPDQLPPFNDNPKQILPESPPTQQPELPTVENCCTEVNQILNKVNLVLTGTDYASRFDTLDVADVEQNDKLDILLDDPIVEISVPIGQCLIDENGLPFYEEQDFTVSTLKSDADRALTRQVNDNIITKIDCNAADPNQPAVAAIPENWQIRLGANRPRLVQIMRRGSTRNYHQFSIPHPINTTITDVPFISQFEGGNWQVIIRCTDSSRFIAYCRTKTIAQQVANQVVTQIDPAFLDSPPKIQYTELQGQNISTDMRIPTKNAYFETGNLNNAPTWEKRIPGGDT